MTIDISKQEVLRLLDAIEHYKKDYILPEAPAKSLENLRKKLKTIIK